MKAHEMKLSFINSFISVLYKLLLVFRDDFNNLLIMPQLSAIYACSSVLKQPFKTCLFFFIPATHLKCDPLHKSLCNRKSLWKRRLKAILQVRYGQIYMIIITNVKLRFRVVQVKCRNINSHGHTSHGIKETLKP